MAATSYCMTVTLIASVSYSLTLYSLYFFIYFISTFSQVIFEVGLSFLKKKKKVQNEFTVPLS